MRTKEEIDFQIKGLEKSKETVPEYSAFGDNNWEQIDAQISIIKEEKTIEDFDEESDEIYFAADLAVQWLNEEYDSNLFD